MSQQPFAPQQVLAQRLAVVLGGNQRLQQCQDKIAELTEKISERWKAYHNDQVAFAGLQNECATIRTQVHSLQLKLAEKLIEQRTKALESEHGLRHINDMLEQSRALSHELEIAKRDLATFTTQLKENIAAGQVPFGLAAAVPAINECDQQEEGETDDIGFVAVKRERDETFDDIENGDIRRVRANVQVQEKIESRRRSACFYFNERRGCIYSRDQCKRLHRCSVCWARDHGAGQCDVEVYDRRN